MVDSTAINPDYVRSLTTPTDHFLCKMSDNTFGIKFGAFRIRDMISGITLVDVPEEEILKEEGVLTPEQLEDPTKRLVKYHFGPDFLQLQTIGLKVEFSVGENPVHEMIMIERHYFKEKCIKSYEFNFAFCIPNSKNSWEVIYDMPQLTPEEK